LGEDGQRAIAFVIDYAQPRWGVPQDGVRATLALAHRSTVRTTHDASSFIPIACPRTRPQDCGRVWRLASCVVGSRVLTDGSRCARSRAAHTQVQPWPLPSPWRRRASWSNGA